MRVLGVVVAGWTVAYLAVGLRKYFATAIAWCSCSVQRLGLLWQLKADNQKCQGCQQCVHSLHFNYSRFAFVAQSHFYANCECDCASDIRCFVFAIFFRLQFRVFMFSTLSALQTTVARGPCQPENSTAAEKLLFFQLFQCADFFFV